MVQFIHRKAHHVISKVIEDVKVVVADISQQFDHGSTFLLHFTITVRRVFYVEHGSHSPDHIGRRHDDLRVQAVRVHLQKATILEFGMNAQDFRQLPHQDRTGGGTVDPEAGRSSFCHDASRNLALLKPYIAGHDVRSSGDPS